MEMKTMPGFAKKADLESFYRVVHGENCYAELSLNKRLPGIGHTYRSIEQYPWEMHLGPLEPESPEERLQIGAIADEDVRPEGIDRIDDLFDGLQDI